MIPRGPWRRWMPGFASQMARTASTWSIIAKVKMSGRAPCSMRSSAMSWRPRTASNSIDAASSEYNRRSSEFLL